MTDKEQGVLNSLLSLQQQFPDMNVFTSEFKRKVASENNIRNFNTLNMYFKSLRDKKALYYKEGNYIFSPLLDYQNNNGIEFVWQ